MPEQDLRTVTKRELVNRIAEDTGQTKVVVRDVIQRFLESVIDELSVGNRLEFRDFGVFEVRERAARVAQNPRTLEKVPVPAKRVVKFKVGRVMRQRVCDEIASGDEADAQAAGAGAGSAGNAGQGGRDAGSNRAGGAQPTPGHVNGARNGEERAEPEERKPQPPTPPPSKPGSPF